MLYSRILPNSSLWLMFVVYFPFWLNVHDENSKSFVYKFENGIDLILKF